MRLTKFELMRLNRKKADARSRNAYRAESPSGGRGLQTLAAAVPTMEIDGVKYREAPADADNTCSGCAGASIDDGSFLCDRLLDVAMDMFGVGCGTRNVIYIKAE